MVRLSFADARIWQTLSLGVLLTCGVGMLGFDQTPSRITVILAAALATQWVGGRLLTSRPFDPLSPLITGLSLSLLLRASSPAFLAAAAALAIGSKLLLRIDGRHIFNPANFAIVALLLFTDQAWISPAQWGSDVWWVFLFTCLAALVLSRARRGDVAIAFLLAHLAILLARALYLGDPLAIPMRQMQSGALLLFTFFMITDPKTTPDRRSLRIVFAVLVACLGAWLQFAFFLPQALMYALFFASPLMFAADRLAPRDGPGIRLAWTRRASN
jgi:Na+-transporting NADH:ubiquinone oxidoreductase subunit NqrB